MQQKKSLKSFTFRYAALKSRGSAHILLAIVLFGLVASFLSACGSDTAASQQASRSRQDLENTIQHARDIGVPDSSLKPVLDQEQELIATNAPITLFNEQPLTDYYHNITARYAQLKIQTEGIVQVITEQFQQQAQANLNGLQHALAARQNNHLPLATITQLYNTNQSAMQRARYPKDYSAISSHARDAVATLNMMPDTMQKIQTLGKALTLMQQAKQNVTDLQQRYTDDKNAFAKAVTPHDLQQVNQSIDSLNQQASSRFQQIIPLLTQAKIDDFSSKVQQLKQYDMDNSSYLQKLNADRVKSANVKTMQDYMIFSDQVDSDMVPLQTALLKGQSITLIQQFHQEVNNWGNAHQYYDPFDNQNYPLDQGYMAKGVGEDLDRELNTAQSASDYQNVLTDAQNEMFHLHMMEQNFNDKTPYTQAHSTDLKLLNYYKLDSAKVIIVSFTEEALRVYDHGNLIRAYLITAGRPELPPVPGLWTPLWRQTHTTFKSPYPKGSPYWYPDTPINYAILYHQGGYYLHDSWWRNDYGPGTQFYHIDSSGNTSANYGTHGCINMPEDQAQWLYNNTDYNTQILMY